jgi:hypothetical protein
VVDCPHLGQDPVTSRLAGAQQKTPCLERHLLVFTQTSLRGWPAKWKHQKYVKFCCRCSFCTSPVGDAVSSGSERNARLWREEREFLTQSRSRSSATNSQRQAKSVGATYRQLDKQVSGCGPSHVFGCNPPLSTSPRVDSFCFIEPNVHPRLSKSCSWKRNRQCRRTGGSDDLCC